MIVSIWDYFQQPLLLSGCKYSAVNRYFSQILWCRIPMFSKFLLFLTSAVQHQVVIVNNIPILVPCSVIYINKIQKNPFVWKLKLVYNLTLSLKENKLPEYLTIDAPLSVRINVPVMQIEFSSTFWIHDISETEQTTMILKIILYCEHTLHYTPNITYQVLVKEWSFFRFSHTPWKLKILTHPQV